jgi:hypothetical protein
VPPASATSQPVLVRAKSSTALSLSRHFSVRERATTATIHVTADGDLAGGTVQLTVGGRPVGGLISLDAKGRATVTLPALGRGIHLVRAEFSGTGEIAPSTSGPEVLVTLF